MVHPSSSWVKNTTSAASLRAHRCLRSDKIREGRRREGQVGFPFEPTDDYSLGEVQLVLQARLQVGPPAR